MRSMASFLTASRTFSLALANCWLPSLSSATPSPGADVFLDDVQAVDREVELVLVRVLEQQKVARRARQIEAHEALVAADAVIDVHDGVADGEIRERLQARPVLRAESEFCGRSSALAHVAVRPGFRLRSGRRGLRRASENPRDELGQAERDRPGDDSGGGSCAQTKPRSSSRKRMRSSWLCVEASARTRKPCLARA